MADERVREDLVFLRNGVEEVGGNPVNGPWDEVVVC